jgi:hypothetical protein
MVENINIRVVLVLMEYSSIESQPSYCTKVWESYLASWDALLHAAKIGDLSVVYSFLHKDASIVYFPALLPGLLSFAMLYYSRHSGKELFEYLLKKSVVKEAFLKRDIEVHPFITSESRNMLKHFPDAAFTEWVRH